MEIKKLPESASGFQELDENIQWNNFGWWLRQFKLGVRGPRGVVTIIAMLIGLSCNFCGYGFTMLLPIQTPIIGLLASYFSVIQERGNIHSRKQGGVIGMISAIFVSFVPLLANIIFYGFGLSVVLINPSLLPSLPDISNPLELLSVVVLFIFVVPTANILITAVIGYFAGFLSIIPEKSIEYSDRLEKFRREADVSGGIFISYSQVDKSIVQKLSKRFDKDEIPYWQDEKDLRVGQVLDKEISEGIQKNWLFLAVLSPASITSNWVEREFDEASYEEIKGKKVILPIVVNGLKHEDIPARVQRKIYVDLTIDFEAGYKILRRSIFKYMAEYEEKKKTLQQKD